MDTDGAKTGFELKLQKQISKIVNIPVIASGGAGTMEHIKDAFECGASAALLLQFSTLKRLILWI
jgi:cyclase